MGDIKRKTCGDCGIKEGQLHQFGCDMEICPYCGGQLISCGHFKDVKDKDRIPFVLIPQICPLCGELWPDFFMVPDSEWKKYIIPELQKKILCKLCYEKQKILFPKGWKRD